MPRPWRKIYVVRVGGRVSFCSGCGYIREVDPKKDWTEQDVCDTCDLPLQLLARED